VEVHAMTPVNSLLLSALSHHSCASLYTWQHNSNSRIHTSVQSDNLTG